MALLTYLPGGLRLGGEGLTVDAGASIGGEMEPTSLILGNVAVTATSDGLTTGVIPAAAAFVTVTSANAAHIVALPAPVVGQIIVLRNGATGYELRSSAPATVAINGGTGASAESAIAASTMVIAVCTTLTSWQCIGIAGATLAAVEAAA